MDKLFTRELYNTSAPNSATSIINAPTSNVLNWDDVRFDWAYPKYKRMLANFWTPFEINMSGDIKQWNTLTPEEQFAFKRIIGLLSFLDSIQTDYSFKVSNYITDSSLNALMVVLAFQEVVHNQSYSYVLSSLVPKHEQDEIFEYWKHDEILKKRNEFIAITYDEFVINPTPLTLAKSIVKDVVLEGLDFYSGFAFFYNLARNQKMVSTSTMINYINRDEQIHVDLFCKVFKALLDDYPELDTPEMVIYITETFRKAAELEIEWAQYVIGWKIPGIDLNELEAYIKFMANVRSKQLGGKRPFPEYTENPMRWVVAYQEVDLGKTDFFEQKSRQYTKVDEDNGFDDL